MRGLALEVREEKRRFRETVEMRNAVARIARRRWPTNGIKSAQAAWGLSEGEARNLYYGNCSANTFSKVLSAGRWPILLEIGAIMLGESVDQFAASEQQRLAHEHARSVRNLHLVRSLAGCGASGDRLADQRASWLPGQQDGDLGDQTDNQIEGG